MNTKGTSELKENWAGGMDHQVKVSVTKSTDLTVIPKIHMMEEN